MKIKIIGIFFVLSFTQLAFADMSQQLNELKRNKNFATLSEQLLDLTPSSVEVNDRLVAATKELQPVSDDLKPTSALSKQYIADNPDKMAKQDWDTLVKDANSSQASESFHKRYNSLSDEQRKKLDRYIELDTRHKALTVEADRLKKVNTELTQIKLDGTKKKYDEKKMKEVIEVAFRNIPPETLNTAEGQKKLATLKTTIDKGGFSGLVNLDELVESYKKPGVKVRAALKKIVNTKPYDYNYEVKHMTSYGDYNSNSSADATACVLSSAK